MGCTTFNLVDQPWVPVLLNDRRTQVDLGLRDCLARAHEIWCCFGDNPAETAAIHRLLLAVLYQVYQRGPRDADAWKAMWTLGRFTPQYIDAYLGAWIRRFDLFDPERPFAQDPNLVGREITIAKLQLGRAAGNMATLFDWSMDNRPDPIPPAKAARALLSAQAFSTAQIGGFTDAPCARGVIFFAEGDTLFETLMLNLFPPIPAGATDDRPSWEMDDPFLPDRQAPLGIVDRYTWLSRRIVLLPEIDQGQTVVRRMMWAPGLSIVDDSDPMKRYRLSTEGTWRPLRVTKAGSVWTNFALLVQTAEDDGGKPLYAARWIAQLIASGHLDRGRMLRFMALGVINYLARIEGAIEEHMPFTSQMLASPGAAELIAQAIDLADQVRRVVWGSAQNIAIGHILGPEKIGRKIADSDRKAVNHLVDHWGWEQIYWAVLDVPFRSLLKGQPGASGDVLLDWKAALRQAAEAAHNVCTASLGEGGRQRRQITAGGKGYFQNGLSKVLGTETLPGEDQSESVRKQARNLVDWLDQHREDRRIMAVLWQNRDLSPAPGSPDALDVRAQLDRLIPQGVPQVQKQCYYLVAVMFARLCSNTGVQTYSFGASMRLAGIKPQRAAPLLTASREDVPGRMVAVADMLKNANIRLDYEKLFVDLWYWGDRVRERWTMAYYRQERSDDEEATDSL